jgi:hypothetical protein
LYYPPPPPSPHTHAHTHARARTHTRAQTHTHTRARMHTHTHTPARSTWLLPFRFLAQNYIRTFPIHPVCPATSLSFILTMQL